MAGRVDEFCVFVVRALVAGHLRNAKIKTLV